VSGAICLYGYYGRTVHDDPDSTPAAHMHPDAPPFYLLHGHRDTVVPVEWGRDFACTLAATSRQPVVWSELPDAQHSFDFFASLRARLVADRIEAFTAFRAPRRRPDWTVPPEGTWRIGAESGRPAGLYLPSGDAEPTVIDATRRYR
jgi:acetyl esterase/lipase